MKRRTEITFEVEETVVSKRGGKFFREYCPRCESVTEMASPEVLASLTGSSEREIFRLVELGSIHFIETDRLVVCACCYRRSTMDGQFNDQLRAGQR